MKLAIFVAAILLITTVAQYPTNTGGAITLPSSNSTSANSGSSSSLAPVPNFPTANINNLVAGTVTSDAATAKNVIDAIVNGKNETSAPVKSFQSLFQRFPSKTELNKIADDGDTASISKTLQVVASDDSVPCATKVSYIYQLLGIVKAALLRKNLASSQLLVIIDTAKRQIKRLEDQIARITKQRQSLNITQQQERLNKLVTDLRKEYDSYNTIKSNILPEEAKVIGLNKQIETYTKQSDQYRNRISNDRLKLTSTISQIRDLEEKLKNSRDIQATLEKSIFSSESAIRDNDEKVAVVRGIINETNARIRLFNSQADQFKRRSNLIEVDAERLRTDLSVNQEKDKELIEQIRNFQTRIGNEKTKLVEDERNKIEALIDNLQFASPTIQAQINREYYYCYGEGKVQAVTAGKTTVYVVKNDLFPKYVANAYGVQSAPQIKTGADVKFQVTQTFSRPWIKQFGFPSDVNKTIDFSCLGLQGTSISGRGIVENIDSDSIKVRDDKIGTFDISFGACSRIQSITDIPKKGQRILWRGSLSSSGSYSLFSASCY